MHEIVATFTLIVGAGVWITAYFQCRRIVAIQKTLEDISESNTLEMKHLRRELRVPEPVFTTRKSPKRNGKPKVIRKTEEDEYERELPPSKSGEKTIGT